MHHQKCANQDFGAWDPLSAWGKFTRYLEIGDDGYALRQVDVFANGNRLRYSRDHWMDDFGSLGEAKYSQRWDEWWGPSERISADEFEQVWQTAEKSPTYSQQLSSRHDDGDLSWIERRLAGKEHGERQFRQLCAKRGLDWDIMSEDEREAFIDDLVHEDRRFGDVNP